jgi:hypothetical protein
MFSGKTTNKAVSMPCKRCCPTSSTANYFKQMATNRSSEDFLVFARHLGKASLQRYAIEEITRAAPILENLTWRLHFHSHKNWFRRNIMSLLGFVKKLPQILRNQMRIVAGQIKVIIRFEIVVIHALQYVGVCIHSMTAF